MKIITALLLFFIGLPASNSLAIGSENGPWEKYSLSVGGFLSTINSSIRVGSKTLGAGVEVNLEEGLGLDASTTVFRVETLGRFGNAKKHRFDFSYFFYDRNATKNNTQDFEFKDIIFSVGEVIDTTFNIEIYKLNYTYSFIMNEHFNLAAGGGLYVMPIEVSLAAQGGSVRTEDITAPLPSLTLRFESALAKKHYIRQGIELFYLEYDNFRGGILSLNFSYEYLLTDHWGIGFGLDSLRIKVQSDNDDYPGIDLRGEIKFGYSGLMLFAKYYF